MNDKRKNFSNNRNSSGKKNSEKEEFKNSKEFKTFKENGTGWIQDKFTPETIDFCEAFGEYLKEGRLTTSQIRNIYGEVKRIEAKGDFAAAYHDFLLLKPKIAYAAQRAGTRGIMDLKTVLDLAHTAVTSVDKEKQQKAFKNFTDLFEATLAYHKAYGGREK